MSIQIGDLIERRFEVVERVAASAMSRVFRARDLEAGGWVALKVMSRSHREATERFLREVMLVAEIKHPGVVQYVAHGHCGDGSLYLAMEWLDGEDLDQYLYRRWRGAAPGQRHGQHQDVGEQSLDTFTLPPEDSPVRRLSVADTLVLGRRLASAVAVLHSHGVIHRDIKPSNLFLCRGSIDQVKLIDLGTARLTIDGERITSPGMLVGTPHYMAPEQAAPEQAGSDGPVGQAADLWAIGCVLYRCLVGAPPFRGSNLFDVLARIVLDEPSPVESHRPETPRRLQELIRRLLIKDPGRRLADAVALAEELALLQRSGRLSDSDDTTCSMPRDPIAGPGLTAAETRVACMVFTRAEQDRARRGDRESLHAVVTRAGGALRVLVDGSMVVTVPDSDTPTDQALRAARAALAMRDACPELALMLATGRASGADSIPIGRVVSRAAAQLRTARPGLVYVDAATAALLDSHFRIGPSDDGDDGDDDGHGDDDRAGAILIEPRPTITARTLLGRPTGWVGRNQELAMLLAMFDACVDEDSARVVLVTSEPGMGKSRLCSELERALETRGRAVEILHGRGDPLGAGSPLAMLALVVRNAARIRDAEPLEHKRAKLRARVARSVAAADVERIAGLLGEMCAVPFDDHDSEPLRAARVDPMLMAQLTDRAWQEWLAAECARSPVILMLDDLHWGDHPSIRHVDAALAALREHPFMVVALGRPEVHGIFPRLWAQRGLYELPLHPLSRKACTALIRDALGPDVSDAVAAEMLARAGGNAFYLEELIRAVAEGASGVMPDSVLGMVQARLGALGAESRRILRAASILGESFWDSGVAALLRGDTSAFDVSEWLADLVAREVIERLPESRVAGATEYRFRHALVRDAAYAMLTDDDRRLGHGLVGAWLEQAGERDAGILAEHFVRGGMAERAAHHFLRAAEQALEHNQLDETLRLAERAIACGVSGPALGMLGAVQAVASFWLGDYAAAERHGSAAIERVPEGEATWFRVAGTLIAAAARAGNPDACDRWIARATRATSRPGAEVDELICLCRGAFQMLMRGQVEQAQAAIQRIMERAARAPRLDPLTAAQIHHVQQVRAVLVGDVAGSVTYQELVVDSFQRAGDMRNMYMEQSSLVVHLASMGAIERAEALCRRNLEQGARDRAPRQALGYARLALGWVLVAGGVALDEARQLLLRAERECAEARNPRLLGWTQAALAKLEHLSGDHGEEEARAAAAVAIVAGWQPLRCWALSLHARALLCLGRSDEALEVARRARQIEASSGMLFDHGVLALVHAQALAACGHTAAGRDAALQARARLLERAAAIDDTGHRARFLAFPDHQLTLELAAAAEITTGRESGGSE